MEIRRITTWKRYFASSAETAHAVQITIHCSQAELNTLKQKGIVEFLGGN